MHGRSCGFLLVILLLALYSPFGLWGQTSVLSAKGTLSQPVPSHPQPPTWPGSTPFRPKPPGPIVGLSPSLGAPTFPQMARAAGTIFAGTVTKIERGPVTGGTAIPTVAITFRVERPLRGAARRGNVTILEWLGLWSSGQRYEVGEHVLVFLYRQSKLGLTSSVGGRLGRFRLDPAGRVLPSEQQLATFQADPRLAGRSRINLYDFARALRHAIGAEDPE
jgi:hypothetical protein